MPVLVDRVRVAAADLHDLERAAGLDEAGELGAELLRELARAELVDEPHDERLHLLERDARVAEQQVADDDRLDELDRDLLARAACVDVGQRAVHLRRPSP